MPGTAWVVLLTVNAHPHQPDQLAADLPESAEIFYSSPGMPPRTGIALRMNTLTLVKAATSALNTMVDSLDNLGRTPVTSMQVFTVKDFTAAILPGDVACFNALLFGPAVEDLPTALRGDTGKTTGTLADLALDD